MELNNIDQISESLHSSQRNFLFIYYFIEIFKLLTIKKKLHWISQLFSIVKEECTSDEWIEKECDMKEITCNKTNRPNVTR